MLVKQIEEVSFSLTFAPDITEKEIFNLEQIIKNQLFSFEDTNTQEHYRFVQEIEEVSFSLTFAPDITEKEIFNLEQIIKNQLFSFEDTNTQEHYRFVQAIDFTLLNK